MGDARIDLPGRMRGPRSATSRRPPGEFWAITALTLLAAAFRFVDLSARTYWSDEGFTLYRIFGSWADVVSNFVNLQGLSTSDIHPPLYFVALKLWITAGGTNEFLMRAFSVFCGILIVPLTYALGRRAFGRAAGVFAALLAALCPAYEWYAWEIRMYSLTPMLAALTTYLLVRAVSGPRTRPRALMAWVVMSLVSVFTHYSSVSLLLAQVIFAVPMLIRSVRKIRVSYVVGLAVLGVAVVALVFFLPGPSASARQIMNLLLQNASQPRLEPVSVISIVHDVLGASTFGMNAADPTGGWLEVCIAALTLMGILIPLSRERLGQRVFMTLCIVTPIIFWSALSYVLENRPSFRYVIIVLPAMHALLGRVGAAVWRELSARARPVSGWRIARPGLGIATMAFILGANSFGLQQTFVRTPSWQDDWLSLARYIRQNWQPGDAFMINLYTPEAVMEQFLGDVPMDILIARQWVGSAGEAELAQRLRTKYTRVWHANTGGDSGYMSAEVRAILAPFDRRLRITFPSRTNILQLDRYDTRENTGEAAPPDARPLSASASPATTLPIAYRLRPGGGFGQTPSAALTLFWARGRDTTLPASVSIRLLDRADGVWMDWNVPAELGGLPRSCVPGKVCGVDYTLLLPPGLPPIAFRFELTTLSESGQPLSPRALVPLDGSDVACCLRVQRPLADRPGPGGDDVAIADAEFPDTLHPGDPLSVVLTWRLKQRALPNWTTRLILSPLIGPDVDFTERAAGPPDLPPAAWPIGELIRDQYSMRLPSTIAPGLYRLSLARSGSGVASDAEFLGPVRIVDFPRTPLPVQIQTPVDARVGEMTLLGFGADAPPARGRTIELRTLWRVDGTPARDGVLFVHVLSPEGKLVAQDDHSPEQGMRSTQTYRAGDGIEQKQRLTLSPDLPAGEYRVLAGIYDRSGGARWPAIRDGKPAVDDLVPLMTFTLPAPPEVFRAFLPVVSAAETP